MPSIKAPASVAPGTAVDVDLDGFKPKERIRVLLDGASADSTVRARTDGTDRIARVAPTTVGTHRLVAERGKPWAPVASTEFVVADVAPPVPGPDAPVADFTITPQGGVAGTTFLLTGTSTGNPTKFQWDIGAGMFRPTEKDATVLLPAADTWNVVYTVENAAGQKSEKRATIVVTAGVPIPPAPGVLVVTSSIAPGAVIKGSVSWSAVVSGGTPSKVEFYVDGALRATDLTSTYSAGTIDTTALLNGPHAFTVRAYDSVGGYVIGGGNVTVDNVAPIPGPEPPVGKTLTVPPGGNFKAALGDGSLDRIILGPGNHSTGFCEFPLRQESKPLLVSCEGAIIRGQWAFGGGTDSSPASAYVTVTGPSFRGNVVADTGIVYFGYGIAHHILLRNLDFQGNTSSVNPQNAHHIYLSQGTISDIVIDGMKVVGPGGSMAGFHAYHSEGSRKRITLRNFDFSRLYCGILAWQTITDMLFEKGTIHDSNQGIDISNAVSGIIREVTVSNAGGNKIGSGMVKGPGNVGW